MEKRVYKILEFEKIKTQLAEFASSEMAKQQAVSLEPETSKEKVERLLTETEDAVALILRKGQPPLAGGRDITPSVKRAGAGGILSFAEILSCGGILKAARRLLNYASSATGSEDSVGANTVEQMIAGLTENFRLESDIFKCIISENEMADEASPLLYDIRRQIRDRQQSIKDKLSEFVRSSKASKAIQDGLVTVRQDRYCIPVKTEFRSEFPGMVHDMSSSGQTLFIEPDFVVDANNKIRELRVKEQQEIERILALLSAEIGNHEDVLISDCHLLALIDFTFAKASLALSMKAQKPLLNEQGIIRIVHARHPLIEKHKVVPVTIKLGEGYSTLVITGPNTGGKTVTLKTVGLFTIMMQSGLLVPCDAGSELAIYKNVFADIGDEQSIEQSLSTFSSHMRTIVDILDKCDDKSLVLFDELGAGTDPTEGAALAMAILECVHQMGATTLATTHYSEIKAFTSTTEGFENACCEFSVETLAPTYRLIIGIPGKSNAFAISTKLGLDNVIVERAKEFLTGEDIRFEDMLMGIEKRREEIDADKAEIEKLREEALELRNSIAAEKEKLESQKKAYLAKAREESGKVLLEAKKTADSLLQDIRKAAEETGNRDSLKAAEAAGRELGKLRDDTYGRLYNGIAAQNQSGKAPDSVNIGETVYVVSFDGDATVLKTPGKDGKVYVQAGIIKMYVDLADIRKKEEKKEPQKGKNDNSSKNSAPKEKIMKAMSVKMELDIRGCIVEEGLALVDKYLDDAVLAGLERVNIIHGKGTGVLRKEVQNMLKRDKRVASYRLGEFGEGDAGVTVVTLL